MTTPLKPDFNAVDALTANTGKPKPQAQPISRQPVPTPKPQGNTVQQATGALPIPQGKPDPVLQSVGFHGGTGDFVTRVKATVQAHQDATGQPPSPHLVLDVARSTVPTDAIPGLFKVPKDTATAKAAGVVALHKQQNPNDFFVTRPDGITQPNTPLLRMIQNTPETPQPQLLKQYPMVAMGVLPIPGMDKVSAALNYLNTPPTETPQQRMSPQEQLMKTGVIVGAVGGNPLEAGSGVEAQRRLAVHTIQQAQTELNKEMGTNLPVTGVFNDSWTSALSNWMKTDSYVYKTLQFQAQGEGFGNNVAAYVKAWHAKQDAMKHGLTGQLAAALPTPLFGHGGFWQGLLAVPGYLKGNSANPLNIGLHSLVRSAGLGLDLIGGTVSQAKADAAAATTFAGEMYLSNNPSTGKTYEKALADAKKQLHASPSWLRVAAFGHMPLHPTGTLATIDFATNFLGDLVLLRKPQFTGERVAAGDLSGALKADHLQAASQWAFNDLAKYGNDGIGRAASRLGGEQGARALVARAAGLVKRGEMTQEQFTRHVAELYAHGRTTITVKPATEDAAAVSADVSGPVLAPLRTEKLPTPGKPLRAWATAKTGLRNWLDSYNPQASNEGMLFDNAVSLMTKARIAAAHAAPEGARLGYFQDILPERVFNFVLKHDLANAATANKIESDLVRFQGKQNVAGIQQVEKRLQQLWHAKFPDTTPPKNDDPFSALITTEAPSVFRFPGGGDQRVMDAFKASEQFTHNVNAGLNKAAKIHARIILSGINPFTGVGGFSLMWKHTVGDGLRAAVAGIATALNPETRKAAAELEHLAATDAELGRRYGALLDRLRTSETRWALNRGGGRVFTTDFRTGDHLLPDQPVRNALRSKGYLNAAGGFLRRHLDAQELQAWKDGTLVDMVLRDKNLHALWKKAAKADPAAELSAEDYAGLIAERYKNISDALAARGLTWDDAQAVLRGSRGHDSDAALGKWIQQNRLDFPVDGGQVETMGTFDDLTSRWVGNVIMRPNKFWRSSLGKVILAKHYGEFVKAGMAPRDAFDVASSLTERVVKYHMLDFANRLQIEQDLRWLSYFATKHRLYWKWVMGTMFRNPRYAAAVYDFRKALDSHGGVTLPISLYGLKWDLPLERMVWVPGREYDETSPLASAVFNFVKSGGNLDAVVKGAAGTYGNVLTRSDTATRIATKLLNIQSGHAGATYQEAIAGLDKQTADTVNRALNEYQITYFTTHGHYAPEAQAVKTVLAAQAAEEFWRANLPLPVVPYQDRTSEQQLMAEYMQIVDPAKRRKFLDQHPGFSDNFGVYQDPKTNLHNRELFNRWTKAYDAYRAGRRALYQQMLQKGEWTTDMESQRRLLNDALNRTRNQLLVDDAKWGGVNTGGLVPNGGTVPYGPWGKLMNKDPQFDPAHFLNSLFPKLAAGATDSVIGPLQKQMQAELSLLNDPNYVAKSGYTLEEVKTRKRELLQKLEVFKNYPSDALAKTQDTYQQKFVNAYWTVYNQKYNAINKLPSDQRKIADAAFRAWRDSQDHPVIVDGAKFPSPARMAWAMLDPITREQRLAYLASKPLSDLANYELDLLGVKHPPNVSEALSAIEKAKQDYRNQYGTSVTKQQLVDVAKQIDRQPGYKGFFSYYVRVLAQPRIYQFKLTSAYQDMPPAIKQRFDEAIGNPAVQIAKNIAASGAGDYYSREWRQAMEKQITPWLDEPDQKQLRDYLQRFGPNFLNTLVSS